MKTTLMMTFLVLALGFGAWQAEAITNEVTIDTAGDPLADVTDWADEYCVPDDVCGDFSGDQRDTKGVCIASNFAATDPNPATVAYLRFDFDITGVSGANTVDGCWLVDANQNGMVENALCFSLTGNPLLLTDSYFFTCNDGSATACGGAVPVLPSPAVCAINHNTGTADQILVCPDDTADTAVECSVSLTDLGWASGEISLIRACTSTSAQPNSATFDCLESLVIDPDTGGNTPVELISFQVE
ncbi:MAG: hypothetical protein ABFS37_16235 [Acidobacteriota bacterium]